MVSFRNPRFWVVFQSTIILFSTPQYSMASDVALNLYNVEYKDASDYTDGVEFETVAWIYDELNMRRVITVLQGQWTISSVQ